MAKRQIRLSEVEIAAFRQAEQETRDVYELKRLQAVRLYGSGMSGQSIEALVGCVGRSVRVWTQRYQESGLWGLGSRRGGESCPESSGAQSSRLQGRLRVSWAGSGLGRWTA